MQLAKASMSWRVPCLSYSCMLHKHQLTACNIGLLLAHEHNSTEVQECAKEVACIATRLEGHGITICISLKQPQMDEPGFGHAVLKHLAPLLRHLNYARVLSALVVHTDTATLQGWAPDSIHTLMSATSLRTLCITDRHQPSLSLNLTVIAQLTSLVNLHLDFFETDDPVDFGPLNQLRTLRNLALQSYSSDLDCQGVLQSSRATLSYVTLSGWTWTKGTYVQLREILQLQTLTVKTRKLTFSAAYAISHVQAQKGNRLLLNRCAEMRPASFAVLSGSNLHELVLHGASNNRCECLCTYLHLDTLTLVRSPGLSGISLLTCHKLKLITLVDCLHITAASLQGVVTAAPALYFIAFHATIMEDPNDVQLLQLDSKALQILATGRSLQYVDLCGLFGLTSQDVIDLHWAFHRMQAVDAAQPTVTMWLPYPLDEGIPMVYSDVVDIELEPTVLYNSHNTHRVKMCKGERPLDGKRPPDRCLEHLYTEYV